MIVLLLKSQLGLFDKIVPVSASVSKDGVVRAPHMAVRHVRAAKPEAARRPTVKPDETGDLFAQPAKPAKPKTADSQTLDLFAERPKTDTSPKPAKETAESYARPPASAGALADVKAKRAASAAQADALAAAGQPVKLQHRDGRTAIAGPDVSKPGGYRVTRFDDSGPLGHVEHGSLKAAIAEALSQGFEPVKATAPKERFTYGLTLRPADVSTLPGGYIPGSAKPASEFAHGTAEFSRRLTADEVRHFDLVDLTARKEQGERNAKIQARIDASPTLRNEVAGSGVPIDQIDDALLDELEASATPSAKVVAKVDYDAPFNAAAVPTFGVPAGISKEARRKLNADAALVAERGGDLSPADRELLRQYSGNGGCGDSLNEFYTDPKVAAAMWHAIRGMGISEGTALEPSCATGVFLEVAPAGMRVTGVELDHTSAKIGALLHPAHEVKEASLEGFATQDGRQFDAVLGNAPFGLRGRLLSQDKPDLKTAESYFMDTSLDKTRPGGVVAMIVPTGLMDSKRDRKARGRLLRKGEFLGALRMPNTAFEHSHTGVTSDILFFRKRPEDVAGALGVADDKTLRALGVWDDDYLSGAYFTERGKGNVLGTMTEGWRAQAGMGNDITVEGSMIGVPEAIAAFRAEEPTTPEPLTVESVLAAAPDDATREKMRGAAARMPYDTAKRGAVKVVDGVQYVLEGDPLRWHRVDEFMASKAVSDAVVLSAYIERAIAGDPVEGLADRVKAYVATHGVPSKNHDLVLAAGQDKSLYRLIGAVKPDGSFSDVVSGKKAAPVESTFDAAAQSLAMEGGLFKPEQVSARWHGGDVETVLDHLYASPEYALDPASGLWTSNDIYLSGELWPKFDEATAALADESLKPEDRAKFERQVKLLEETIDPRSLEDVEIALNSAFLPLKAIEAFFNRDETKFQGQYAPARMRVTFDRGVYSVSGGPWGSQLLEKYLNRTGVKREDELPQIERWNADFKEWLCASPLRDEIEETYNRSFRGFRQREYSNAPFEIPGLHAEGLKDYQYGGLRWALEAGKGIIAADVGLGKTARGLILARMAKVTGKAKKPMTIVPKSVLANWVAEAEKWFPGATVMTIGETYTRDKAGNLKGKEDSAAERNRKFHDLAQNDYDFIFISQPAWNDLDLDPVTKGKYIEDDFWVQRGDSLGNAGDKRTNKIRESYEQAIAGREFQKRTDAIYFNDLGVDMLIADEMHAYKNLFAAKNRFGQQPKFLGGSGLSNRALDMALKTRWLREQNGGLNVYGLTATPTKNSPLEVYSMLTHIAPEAFERIGVRNSEEFLDRFCEFRTENVLTTGGKIEEALVTVGFKNLDELREIMRRYIDRKTAEDVGLVLPTRDDRQHLVEMSAQQKEVYGKLREDAEASKGKNGPHIFSVMDQMAKAAMDLELYDPEAYAGAHSPKYAEAAKHISAGAADGGQVVFADSIAVHDKMVAELVKSGIPREQIGVINAQVAASSAKRQNIADAFNAGKLKVVIGNTATMGEGINLQKGTTDIHHLDLPWEPASLQQRNGRGLRQGNLKESVRIHTYIAKGSFDGYRYQTIAAKKDWQDLLWNGGDRVENLAREGALSRDDLMIMLAADPDAAREQMTKNKDVAKAKFEAMKYGEAAENFGRLQGMKRSLAAMKPRDRESTAAKRLKVKADRLRLTLEADPFFKAKHALDAAGPVAIQPVTGDAYQPGVAFEIDKADGAVHGGGKFVVTSIVHDADMGASLRVRRYGEAANTHVMVALNDLSHGARPIDYSEGAEQAEIAKNLSAAVAASVDGLKGYKSLHGLPSAAVEASYDVIQQRAKEGVKAYKFETGYGDIGLIGADGKAKAISSHGARAALDTHDLLLPTDAHRRAAIDAYVADERAKRFQNEYQSGRRGASTSSLVLKYPGDYSHSSGSNRWAGILRNVFGDGAEKDAHAEFERAQLETARRAPTFKDAFGAAALTATGAYNTNGSWPKRALAILWAKAKQEGKLDTPIRDEAPSGMTSKVFEVGNSTVGHETVRRALLKMATLRNYHDLGAAFAVDAAASPDAAARDLLTLEPDAAGPGLRHIVAKHPELADRKASEFATMNAARSGYNWGSAGTPAHPYHKRFGERVNSMTLRELSDELTAGDATDGDERRAA